MWKIMLIFFLLFIMIQTFVIGVLVLYGQSRLNRIETNHTIAPTTIPALRTNHKQTSTNDITRPILTYYNAKSDSQDNEPVTPISTQGRKGRLKELILPKKESSDEKQLQAQAKVKQEKTDIHFQVVDV